MGYGVWFEYKKILYKFPVNPEEIEINSIQAVSKYEVLKLGQVAVPTHMELREYSFEAEFPHVPYHYVVTSGVDAKKRKEDYIVNEAVNFRDADYYLDVFSEWRENLIPVSFIAKNETGKEIVTLVLIEELSIIEKAGEEGDKYIKFKLLEYKNFSKKPADEIVHIKSANKKSIVKKKKGIITPAITPKSVGYYVVQAGDSLWSIAKRQYGDGSKCNIIYNANKDKIKNPGLIRIGWKLKIPAENEFYKYSAALPTTKAASKTAVGKTNSAQTAFQQAGFNIKGYRGGVSDSGRSHSSGGGKF
jgi:nucleoid-associated protein YgaU